SAFRRAASQMPSVDIEVVNPAGEANMGVLMLTELIRKYRDFPLLRALAAGRLPFALGITAEGLSATARVRKPSVVELENGIAAGYNVGGLAIPQQGGIVLDLTRLDRIEVIDEDAMYAVIEPGVTFRQLKDTLAERTPDLVYAYPFAPPSTSVLANALMDGLN